MSIAQQLEGILVEASPYDRLVTDASLKPKPISSYYKKELVKRIGKGTKIKVVKSETTMPRSWDFGNYTVLEITPPGAKKVRAAFTLNVASDEASGSVAMDAPYGVIPGQRSKDPKKVMQSMVSDVGSHLKP